MNKLVLLGAGVAATGAAALITAGAALSQPADASSINVVGEPYLKAQQILKSQGITATFSGSVGSALPQSQCLVGSQKVNSVGKMLLTLDCSAKAEEQLKAMGPAGGPRVGKNGVTTVTPTPMVPIAGAPGAGAGPIPAR
ncbi:MULTISPECIES: hypothetical protein [unclassified Mycobacterium]|uniref:hypothetical protein n=1 Tax=unclassified Mycobacterium TaxID=2642494 RepID=UPI00341DD8FC